MPSVGFWGAAVISGFGTSHNTWIWNVSVPGSRVTKQERDVDETMGEEQRP